MNKAVSAFLSRHNFCQHVDVNTVIDALLYDMNAGLDGKASDEDMIKTWMIPPKKQVVDRDVIVIDAGGTNFRSCLVKFDSQGKPSIVFMEKTAMPGVEKELTREVFFDQIAENLEHLKNKSSLIGFCFSYPMEITSDGDAILLGFSKEVKAPEVVGSRIGKSLSDALVKHGWKRPERITLLNDTVAALLAGASQADTGNKFSSYIGLILGTGMNAAYIQPEVPDRKDFKQQIIVCESGKFSHLNRSDFDKIVDSHTVRPGTFLMEKICSGAYLGPESLEILHGAASDGLLSKKCTERILAVEKLSLIEMDSFLHRPYDTNSVLGAICADSGTPEDYDIIYQILDAVVERSARYTSAILAASVIQCGEGTNGAGPVCILCNGTTFHKTHNLKARVFAYLDEVLTRERGLYFKMVAVENDITFGAAVAGLIERT